MSATDADRGARSATLRRKSRETEVLLSLELDPELPGAEIDSGIGFLDHMLTALATHAGWRLRLACRGDLVVDDHHSAEDCALALGEAFARALSRGGSPRRFASAHAPLDEALARAVVDFSGRPYCHAELGLSQARLGALAGENVAHFFVSFATTARITLHIDVLSGENAHHRAEAAFKALAFALREASALPVPAGAAGRTSPGATPGAAQGESTKGSVLLEELGEAELARGLALLKGGSDAR